MRDFTTIQAAWKTAQKAGDAFHETFRNLIGLTEEQVTVHFVRWNLMPHEEAEAIANKHGTTNREGGFQAYLAEQLNPRTVNGANLSELRADAVRALALFTSEWTGDETMVEVCEPDFITEECEDAVPYLSIDGGSFLLVPVPVTEECKGITTVTVNRDRWDVHVASGGPTNNDPFEAPDIEEIKTQGGTFMEAVCLVASLWAQDIVGNRLQEDAEARALAEEPRL
jgi:hypothetical protein